MAKRKTKKVEKVIDLTPKVEKVSDTQLNRVQATVGTMDKLTMELGRFEMQKHQILKGMENVQTDLDNLRAEFKREYGTDNINIQDGAIAYPPENPNPEGNGETNKEY